METDNVPRSQPTLYHLQEDDNSCLGVRIGGRLRNGKDVGSGEEAGFTPMIQVIRRFAVPGEENKVKFA